MSAGVTRSLSWQAIALSICALAAAVSGAAADPGKSYADHCAACHGADRFGGMGPALLPSNLERLRRPLAEAVVAKGRIATQMPGFAEKLSPDEIRQVVELIYREPPIKPVWDAAQIIASRIEHRKAGDLPSRPAFSADPLNLFVVVEGGDHHVSVLDGERFEPMTRFASRYALHGGPKFSPDGRFVYFASRDGWISKYDLWSLSMVSEVRAGLNTRNAAVSADGKYVMVANYLPHSLVLLDADLKFLKLIVAADAEGKRTSRVSAVYDAAPRKSFIVAMKDLKELWEVSYDPDAAPVYQGLVHDYRSGEGIAAKGQFTPRRVPLDDYMDDFFFDPSYAHAIGASRNEKGEGDVAQVINLFARRRVATLDLPGMPHLASGITWERNGRTLLATPNLARGVVTVIDAKDWKLVREITTLGPGYFLRSHEKTPYAWVDAMMSPAHKDTLQLIDKQTLEKVAELRPEPGKTLGHIEFTRDGRYALASLWEDNGAVIVFDAATLKEVKRIPMSKPVGKYNVYNKINRSEGTSH